jgi:hypothetical protein
MLSYDYAVLRIVPSVEREEFLNAGVVLQCPERPFLGCRVHIDRQRLQTLWPALDPGTIQRHLEAFHRICEGDPAAGPIAGLSRRERFQWLVAPRSTVIQVSAVHGGVCDSPETALEELFRRLVLRSAG